MALCVLGTALVAAPGCSRNPATGQLQFGLPSDDDEIVLGREADAQVRAAMAPYDEVPTASKRVADIGARIAAASERPELPWSFTLVDDPAVNAFALPGGFVYVTRGLLAHLGSDDELAAVLAHEAGHVTARHGVVQLRKQTTARRSVGLFRVIDPQLRHVGGIAARTAGLALLRYSREDEHEADDLAVRYVTAGGWKTAALVRVFAVLDSLPSKGDKPPPWLSTHPDAALRRDRTAAALGIPQLQSPAAEPSYLAAIEGLAFGDDPRDGYLVGNTFVQPRRGFTLQVPPAWKVLHDRDQVLALSEDERAIFVSMPTKYEGRKAAIADFFADGAMTPGAEYEGAVGGFPVTSRAFAMADRQGNTLMGLVAFIDYESGVIAMVALGPEDGWAARSEVLARSFGSFGRITDPQLKTVQPLRIHTVVPDAPSTLADIGRRAGSPIDAATLAVLNGVDAATSMPAGWPVKVPVLGRELPWAPRSEPREHEAGAALVGVAEADDRVVTLRGARRIEMIVTVGRVQAKQWRRAAAVVGCDEPHGELRRRGALAIDRRGQEAPAAGLHAPEQRDEAVDRLGVDVEEILDLHGEAQRADLGEIGGVEVAQRPADGPVHGDAAAGDGPLVAEAVAVVVQRIARFDRGSARRRARIGAGPHAVTAARRGARAALGAVDRKLAACREIAVAIGPPDLARAQGAAARDAGGDASSDDAADTAAAAVARIAVDLGADLAACDRRRRALGRWQRSVVIVGGRGVAIGAAARAGVGARAAADRRARTERAPDIGTDLTSGREPQRTQDPTRTAGHRITPGSPATHRWSRRR